MQAEPSYVTSLVRRIIRLLSGMIVGVLLLLIFERITVIDALFLIVMSVLFSAYLTRNEGRALAQLKNYFRAKAGAIIWQISNLPENRDCGPPNLTIPS